ncbi:MAG: polyprenyl synthetase family protein [Candidatus Fermentibacteraceae bacterium]
MDPLLRSGLDTAALWVEAGLESLFMYHDGTQLPEHCRYALSTGGKRLRPFLVRQACLAMGGDPERALPAACAVEMVHTYSLVHDDLPSMDDDDTRRGMPTLHKHAGEANAILAGDRLLVEAFRTLSLTPGPPGRVNAMLMRLAEASGARYLVGGQFMDMFPPEDADEAWITTMVRGKTAALIRVSLELGAMSAGAGPELLNTVSELGDRLGFLFQLTDDILDVTGSQTEMGKAVGKDASRGKWNPVAALGLSGATARAVTEAAALSDAFLALGERWRPVADLCLYLPGRRN